MAAKDFSNKIKGLEGIDTESLQSNDQATVDVTAEASINTSDVSIQLKPTVDQKALKDATEQVEKQVAYINKLAASAGQKSEVGKRGTYTSTAGFDQINAAMAQFSQNGDYSSFTTELKKQLEIGRKKSGSEAMRKAATTAAKQFNTLTIDVENTFKEGGITGDILSVSSKHSQDSSPSTMIRTDYKKLIASNIKYWANSGNQANVELLKQVEAGLDQGANEAKSGNPNYRLVNASQMRSGIVSTINNSPSAVLQGVNFSTDVQKLVNFIGTKSKASTTASNALLGGVSLDKDFMKYFGLNDFTPGRSVTHMADLLGLLPKVSRAHEGGWDVEVTEQIGAVIHSLNEYEKTLASGGTSVPPVVKSLKNRLSQPTVIPAYQGRVIASSALQHLNQISVGNIPTIEAAEEKAQNLVNNVSAQSVGKLVDFTSPEYNLPATSIPSSQKGLVKQQLTVSRAKIASNDLFDISPGSEGIEKYAMLQASALAHDLSSLKYTDKRALSPDDQVGVVSDALYNRLNNDFSYKLRDTNGQIHTGVSEHIDLDKIVSSVDSILVNNGKFTANVSGVGTPDATAFIVNAVKNAILRGINSDLKIGGIDNIALDKTDSSLPKEVFPIQEARKGIDSASRNVGLKAVSKFILSKIGTDGELNLSSDKLVSETRRHIENGFFERDETEELSKPTTDNVNALNAYKDYTSKLNIARGSNYENTSAPIDYLTRQGYSLVKPRETGENAEYEHSGIFGQMEGHPDLLASRVVPKLDGSLERRYLLPDIKSPNKLPKSFSDVEGSGYSREWIAQIISYAQMLPESIRNFLDIGILAGKPNEPGSEVLVTKPYNELVKNPVWATLVEELHKVKVGSAAHLTSLPNNMLPAGPVLSADITADEQNNVNRLINERNDVGPKYVEKLVSLANRREGASQGSLIHEYTKQNVTGGDSLKSTIDSLYNEHLFGQVSKDQFASNSLSLLLEAINVPKAERKNTILDKLTGSFNPNETIQSRLVGLEIQEKPGVQPKISKITNEQLRKYFDRMSNSINEFWAGAFASDELQGRKISNKYAKTINTDIANPASSPGALSFEDAERRARIEKSLLAGYNRADLDAQNLVFSAEAKKAAVGTSDGSNYLHNGIAPNYSKKSTDGEITYEESIAEAMQRKQYYAAQLDTFKGSSSTFDILNKLKTREDTKRTSDIAAELNRVLSLQHAFNESSEADKGTTGFQYARAYRRLANFNEPNILSMTKAPEDMFKNMPESFGTSYLEAANNHYINSSSYAPANIQNNDEYLKRLEAKKNKLSLDSQLNRHIASYVSENEDTNLELISTKSDIAGKQEVEARAIANFLQKHQKQPEKQSNDPMLSSILAERTDLAAKHQNNLQKQFKTADTFGLSTENLSQIISSASTLSSLGESSSIGSYLEKDIIDFSGSKQLAQLKTAANLKQTSKLSGSDYQRQLESYASGITNQIAGLLGSSNIIDSKASGSLYSTGRNAESALTRYSSLNSIIEQKELLKQEVSPEDYESRTRLKKELEGYRTDFEALADPSVRLASIKNKEITSESLQVFKPSYVANKADRLSQLQDMSSSLRLAVEQGDMSTTPELLDNFVALHKTYKKSGLDYTKGGLTLNDIMSKYDSNKSIASNFGIEGELTGKGNQFVVASQTLKSSSSGANKFDALITKEKAALASIRELESAFTSISNPDLGEVETEFRNLLETINADTAALYKLEEAKKAAGGKLSGKDEEKLTIGKEKTQANIKTAQDLVEKMKHSDRSKNLTKEDWETQVKDAKLGREDQKYNTRSRATSINALIDSSRVEGSNKFNATHAEFEEAIRLAKELESLGVKTGHDNKTSFGPYSSSQLETMMSNSGHRGKQHLSFTEGLVDQAAWKMQFGGAGAVLGGLSALTVGGFGEAKKFEEDMKNVELVSQASTVQLDQLKNKVVELSTTFTNTPAQLSDGLIILGQAGYKAAESLQLLGPIAQLATATMSDLKQAADITTTVLMSFDKPVANVAEVTNTLAAATIESKLELSSLGTVLNYVASTAHTAGMSLEETETAMGIMSNAGVKASTIGTSLRSILGTLIAPTAAFNNELARIGLTADDVNPQINSMSTILQRLSFKGFNVENAYQGLDKRIAGNISTLMAQADQWDSFQSKITGTDTAEAMAYGQMDTFGAQSKRLGNTFDTTRIGLMSGALEPLKTAAMASSNALEFIGKMAETSAGKSITSFATTGLAIGSFLSVLGGLKSAGSTIVPALGDAVKNSAVQWLIRPAGDISTSLVKRKTQFISPDSLIGQRLSTTTDINKLPVSQQRMHQTIASLGGMAFNLPTLALTAGIGGLWAGYSAWKDSDLPGLGTGKNRMIESKRSADSLSGYIATIEKASQQQRKLALFNRGENSSSTRSFDEMLINTGVFTGINELNSLVVSGSKSNKDMGILKLSQSRDSVDLKTYLSMAKDVQRTKASKEEIESTVNFAQKSYSTDKDAISDGGRQASVMASDLVVRKLKQEGKFYDTEAVIKEVNTAAPGGSQMAKSIRNNVLAAHEEAMSAPNMKEAKTSQAQDAYRELQRIDEDINLYSASLSGKQLNSSDTKRAKGVLPGRAKAFVETLSGDEKFSKAVTEGGSYNLLYKYALNKLEKDNNTDDFFNAIQVIATNSGSKKGTNVRKEFKKDLDNIMSGKGSQERMDELSRLGKDAVFESPEKIMDRATYSESRTRFIQEGTLKLDKFMESNDKLKNAKIKQSKLTAGTQEYDLAGKAVEEARSLLERQEADLKPMLTDSFRFMLPNTEVSNRKFLTKTRGSIGTTSSMGLASLSSDQYDDFAEKMDKLRTRHEETLNQDLVKGNISIKRKVQLQYELDVKDTLHEMILNANKDVFKYSDLIGQSIKQSMEASIGSKTLRLDFSKVESDIETSNAISNMKTAGRTVVSRTPTNYLEFKNSAYNSIAQSPIDSLNIPQFSQDAIYLVSTDAQVEKLNASLKTTLSILSETKSSLGSTKSQDISSLANIKDPELSKQKTLDVEEKYVNGRIEANQRAFSSIKQILEEEIRLRDQLVDKIAKAKDAQAESTRDIRETSKSLYKSAGIDVSEDPKKLIESLKAKEQEYNKRVDSGDVEGANKILGSMKSDEVKELTSGQYANYYVKEAGDVFSRMEKKQPELYSNYTSNLAERANASNNTLDSARGDLAKIISDSIQLAKDKGKINEEQASMYKDKFVKRLEANSGNQEIASSIFTDYSNTPVLQEKMSEGMNTDVIFKHLADTISSSLNPSINQTTEELKKFIEKLGSFIPASKQSLSDITPTEQDVTKLIGNDAAEALGIGSFKIPKLIAEQKTNNVEGWNTGNEIHYTDKKSLIHELVHSKITSEGKQFKGNHIEKELAEEFEVNKRMVQMGQLNQSDVEDRFGLSLNSDSSNLSNEQLNSLVNSRAGKQYSKKTKYSIGDSIAEYGQAVGTQMMYSSNKSIEGMATMVRYNPITMAQDAVTNIVSNATIGKSLIDRNTELDSFKQNITQPGQKYWKAKMPATYGEYKNAHPIYDTITDFLDPTMAIGGVESTMAIKGSKFIAPTMPKILSGAARLIPKVKQPIVKNALKAAEEYTHVATSEIKALYGDHPAALYASHMDDLSPSIQFMDTSHGVYGIKLKDSAKVFNPKTAGPRDFAKLRKGVIEEYKAEGVSTARAKNLANKIVDKIRNPTLKPSSNPAESMGNWQAFEDPAVVNTLRKQGYDAYDFVESTSLNMSGVYLPRTANAKGILNTDSIEKMYNKATGEIVKKIPSTKSTVKSVDAVRKVNKPTVKSTSLENKVSNETILEDTTVSLTPKLDKLEEIPLIGRLAGPLRFANSLSYKTKHNIASAAGFTSLFYAAKAATNYGEKKLYEQKFKPTDTSDKLNLLESTKSMPSAISHPLIPSSNPVTSIDRTISEAKENSTGISNEAYARIEKVQNNRAALEAKKLTTIAKKKDSHNNALYSLNPEAAADGSLDEMRTKSNEQQAQFDIFEKSGTTGLSKYLKKQGATNAEISDRVKYVGEIVESSKNKTEVNSGIQQSPTQSNISTIDVPTLDRETNKDIFSERYNKAANEYGQIRTSYIGLDGKEKSVGVNATAFEKDQNGGYKTTIGNSTTYFGKDSDAAKIIEEQKGYLKNPIPKFSLADEANRAPVSSTDTIINTNDKLIAALDNLRLAFEKNPTASNEKSSSTGSVTVSVNAPVTVTGQQSIPQDVSVIVSKICSDFFNTEFNSRYIKAVQTVSV